MKDTVSIPLVPEDLAMEDSIAGDTATVAADSVGAIVMVDDAAPLKNAPTMRDRNTGESWVMLGAIILFMLACYKFRNNFRYLESLWKRLTEVRERQNLFANTVRETSFLIILNVLCAFCLGTLLFLCASFSLGVNHKTLESPAPWLWCLAIGAVYCLVMPVCYSVWGWTFAGAKRRDDWVNAFLSMQALAGIALFPFVLSGVFYFQHLQYILILPLAIYAAGKILYLAKGLRIFMKDFSSWLVFLCYLCNLEIVPLLAIFFLGRLTFEHSII